MLDTPITPHVWLQFSSVVRNELAKLFGMQRSTSPVCITERGKTRIESDGFTVDDLRALNAESMQKFLGFSKVDLEADVNALLEMCAKKVERGPSAIVEKGTLPVTPEPADIVEEYLAEPPKRYCEFCTSKGARHKNNCTRNNNKL